MANRSFEQKVRDELADIRLQPDASVWVTVKSALHKEKKRRWIIWLFFLMGGCGGASLWLYHEFSDGQNTNQFIQTVKTDHPSNKEKNILPVLAAPSVPGKRPVTEPVSGEMRNRETVLQNRIFPGTVIRYPALQKEIKNKPDSYTGIKKDDPLANTTDSSISRNSNIINDTETTTKIDSMVPGAVPVSSQMIIHENHEAANVNDKDTIHNTDPVAITQQPRSVAKRKWQWNIQFAGGVSNTMKGFFNGMNRSSVYNNPSLSAPGNGQSGGGSTFFDKPAQRTVFSYNVGMELSRQSGKQNRLGIYFGYAFYQVGINTGNRVDSTSFFYNLGVSNANGYYYRAGNTAEYTEQYHFLIAGINWYMPITVFTKIPVRWQLGGGLQGLISTNSLLYDPGTGSFFSNNALLAKIQPVVSTGFDFSIGKQPLFCLGPHIQYTTNKLSTISGNNRHLLYTSLQFSIALQKKKNKMQR